MASDQLPARSTLDEKSPPLVDPFEQLPDEIIQQFVHQPSRAPKNIRAQVLAIY